MKTWTKTIEINAPIEHVWKFVNGSLEDLQKITPQLVGNTPVKITDEVVGSVYCKKFQKEKWAQEFDVETLAYLNTTEVKKLQIGFALDGFFDVVAFYELDKINEWSTSFTYTITIRPFKWLVRAWLFFATEKRIVSFVEHLKQVAEAEILAVNGVSVDGHLN